MVSRKNLKLVMPEAYTELSVAEMEYDGGWWNSIVKFFGDVGNAVWGGLNVVGNAVWGGLNTIGNALWGGLTFVGNALWNGATGLFGFNNNDQLNHQRNGWGPQSFYNDLGSFRSGISRYMSNPIRYQ